MRRSSRRLTGVVLLLVGLLGGLGVSWLFFQSYLEGVFGSIASDGPSQKLQELNCPLFLSQGERATVTAMIFNPTSQTMGYTVMVETRGLKADPVLMPAVLRVPGGQSLRYGWEVTPQGNGNDLFVVQAASEIDCALPGPFHYWPTSYRQGCSILVLPPPLSGWLLIGMCLACLLGGAGLVFSSRHKSIF